MARSAHASHSDAAIADTASTPRSLNRVICCITLIQAVSPTRWVRRTVRSVSQRHRSPACPGSGNGPNKATRAQAAADTGGDASLDAEQIVEADGRAWVAQGRRQHAAQALPSAVPKGPPGSRVVHPDNDT